MEEHYDPDSETTPLNKLGHLKRWPVGIFQKEVFIKYNKGLVIAVPGCMVFRGCLPTAVKAVMNTSHLQLECKINRPFVASTYIPTNGSFFPTNGKIKASNHTMNHKKQEKL